MDLLHIVILKYRLNKNKKLVKKLAKNTTLSLRPRPSLSKFPVSLAQVSPKVNIISIVLLSFPDSFIFSRQVP
jgi:hypothetical protein